jgi:photosystem II stability/assembly factor-like uncharacterized protein
LLGGALFSVAALTVVTLAVIRLPSEPTGAANPPRPLPAPAAVQADAGWLAPFEVYPAEWADRQRAFALSLTCPGRTGVCSYGLAQTVNGGQTFTHRSLPLPKVRPATDEMSTSLFVMTAQSLAIEDRGKYWVSHNAGRSWRTDANRVSHAMTSIPAGAVLRTLCPDPNCDRWAAMVIDPETGTRHWLDGHPLARVTDSSGAAVGRDGSRWISGQTADGRLAASFTRDGGRTWSISEFPRPASYLAGPRIIGGGNERFASFTVQRDNAKNGFGPLYRSTDGGRTWSLVARDARSQPDSILGGYIRADGKLLIGSERDGTMISADGGRTFSVLDRELRLAWFTERDGRAVALRDDGVQHTSVDGGMTWQPLVVPEPS